MTFVIAFVLAVLAGATGAIFGIGWLAGLAGAAAVCVGFAILFQLGGPPPAPDSDLPLRKCPNTVCGQETAPDAIYCPRCGQRLANPA